MNDELPPRDFPRIKRLPPYVFNITGELKAEGSSITEGIGQARITKNVEGFKMSPFTLDQFWGVSLK